MRDAPPVAPAAPEHGGRGAQAGPPPSGLAVVGILALGGPKGGEPSHEGAREHPAAGAGRKPWGQQPVVDLPRDRKTVEAPRYKVDTGVVALGTMRIRGVDITFG